MKTSLKTSMIICILWIAACIFIINPVQAFSATHVDYIIDEGGNALVTADYDLSIVESIALSTNTVKDGVSKALRNEYGPQTEIISLDSHRGQFTIPKFADVKNDTIQTPCLDFGKVKKSVDKYWFSKVLNINYAPDITTIRFYNGKVYTYNKVIFIPALTIEI
jgi:hypothetical protein